MGRKSGSYSVKNKVIIQKITGKNSYEICFERRLGNFLKFHEISYEARERYTQLNAEFQRISGRDKKAFLNEQFKEIEEKSRMGKSRDFF